MNLFGIGPAELAIIFAIMLVVAGPKRMLQWAYVAGRQISRLRRMWEEAMAAIKQELEDSGVDPEVTRTVEQMARMSRRDQASKATNAVRSSFKAFTQPLADAVEQIDKEVKESVQLTPEAGTPKAAPANGDDSNGQLAPRVPAPSAPAAPANGDDSSGQIAPRSAAPPPKTDDSANKKLDAWTSN